MGKVRKLVLVPIELEPKIYQVSNFKKESKEVRKPRVKIQKPKKRQPVEKTIKWKMN